MAVTWHDQNGKTEGDRGRFHFGNVETLERDFVLWKLPKRCGRWCSDGAVMVLNLAWKLEKEKLEPAQGIPLMIQNLVLETFVQLEATTVARDLFVAQDEGPVQLETQDEKDFLGQTKALGFTMVGESLPAGLVHIRKPEKLVPDDEQMLQEIGDEIVHAALDEVTRRHSEKRCQEMSRECPRCSDLGAAFVMVTSLTNAMPTQCFQVPRGFHVQALSACLHALECRF
ncbi:unnamed protein product [Symbiodinium sp. CCMP2592]|nr:unnamed protein product [Symbiodinium sp. CCMP2592]